MAGLVPAIHALFLAHSKDVDARDKPGHDDLIAIHIRVPRMLRSMTLLRHDALLVRGPSAGGSRICEAALRAASRPGHDP